MSDLIHQWAQQHRRLDNLMRATREMQLTPQEQYAYHHHLNNLGMGGVVHDDGSVSTYLNRIIGFGDKQYWIPTVWDNKIVPEDEAIKRALGVGLDKFPSYPNVDAAEKRYQDLHRYMDKDAPQRVNASPPKESKD